MIRSSFQVEQSESHCVSMRTWLYLGAIVIGFGLMSLGDPAMLEAEAPPTPAPTAQGNTRVADAAAHTQPTPNRSPEVASVRPRTSEVAPLPSLRK